MRAGQATRGANVVSRSSHGAILLDTLLGAVRNPRVWLLVAGLFITLQVIQHPLMVLPAFAQTERDPALEPDEPGSTTLPDELRSSGKGTRGGAAEAKPWT